jgi:hypothetical protein
MTARCLLVLLMAAVNTSARAQSQPQDHFVLTAAQVARALSGSGIPTSDSQVSLLTRVVATQPDPALDVVSVEAISKEPLAGHTAPASRVKMTCRLPNYCLPFFVTVNWSQPPAGSAGSMSTGKNMFISPNNQFTMRAGSRATLVMDDHRSHIQVAVISLQNGMAGTRIRVSSPDHKQVYFGEVVSANLLKGSF